MNLQKNAESEQKKLADLIRADQQNEIKNINALTFGSEDYKPATNSDSMDADGNAISNVIPQVGTAPNLRGAYERASLSQDPRANAMASALYGQLTKQPDIKEVAQGGSLVGIKNGVATPLYENKKADEIPDNVRGAALRLGLPMIPTSWTPEQRNLINEIIRQDKIDGRSVSTNTTTVNTGKAYGQEFGNLIAKNDVDNYTIAQTAPKILEQSNQIKSLINKGAVTGTGSDFILSAAKVFNVVGANNAKTIKNTELLVSSLGQNVLNNIKTSGLGAGQGFTDKDKIFLERVVGGQIALNKTTLLQLADLQERAARASVTKWNDRVKTIPQDVLQATGIGAITLPAIPKNPTQNPNQLFNAADKIINGG
jgi:hypothetical protein